MYYFTCSTDSTDTPDGRCGQIALDLITSPSNREPRLHLNILTKCMKIVIEPSVDSHLC